jgi:hypothetical protein
MFFDLDIRELLRTPTHEYAWRSCADLIESKKSAP